MKLSEITRKESFLLRRSEFYSQMRDEGLLTEDELTVLLNRTDSEADTLLDAKKKHGVWKDHNTTISFQHRVDNYRADRMGKLSIPEAQWDSENGNGFVYCNERDVDRITKWLLNNDCSDISPRRH